MPSTAWSSGASSKTMLAALPPSSRVSALSVPATPLAIRLPISVEPGERDLVDALVRHQRHPGLARARDDVDDAGRQVGLAAHVGEEERGQRRRGGGLEHDRVARREGRRDLPGEHQQREVPRDDLRGDAERPGDPARERVLELVRPARVVPEVGRRERDVDVAALLDRLAGVHRFEDGELAAALLEDPRDPEQVLGALAARERAPRPGLGAARGADRLVRIGRRALGDQGHRLFRGGVDRGERAAALGRHVAATDEQPVALLDRDDVARLGCRRVLPRDRLAVAEAPARRRAAVRRDEAGGRVGGHARHYVTRSGRCFPHGPSGRFVPGSR